jgi:integrase/recombinase XerD
MPIAVVETDVRACDASVTRRGDAAPGAGAPEAPVMTTNRSCPTVLETCVTERRVRQPRASPHTVASSRDPCSFLVRVAQQRLGHAPSALTLDDLDAPVIGSCREHLEPARGTSARRRTVRLAAMRAFGHWASLRAPSPGGVIQRVWAIPSQRDDRTPIACLTGAAIDARLAAPAQQT